MSASKSSRALARVPQPLASALGAYSGARVIFQVGIVPSKGLVVVTVFFERAPYGLSNNPMVVASGVSLTRMGTVGSRSWLSTDGGASVKLPELSQLRTRAICR